MSFWIFWADSKVEDVKDFINEIENPVEHNIVPDYSTGLSRPFQAFFLFPRRQSIPTRKAHVEYLSHGIFYGSETAFYLMADIYSYSIYIQEVFFCASLCYSRKFHNDLIMIYFLLFSSPYGKLS